MGAGLGFAYLPVSGIVSKHFTKRRSLAMGIITTGTSLGGFTFSVLVSKLLTTILGFTWTVRLTAFIALGCLSFANLLVSQPKITSTASTEGETAAAVAASPKEKEKGPASAEEAAEEEEEKMRSISQLLQDPAYLAIILSGFIACLGLYFPL